MGAAVGGLRLSGASQVRFPAASFVSQAEYEGWVAQFAGTLGARGHFEQMLATNLAVEGAPLVQHGTCAPCLRPATLTSHGASWAREQVCDCEDALPGHARALLHATLAEAMLQPWSRLLIVGPPAPVHRRLRALVREHVAMPVLPPPANTHRHHLVVAGECLQHVADLARAASRLRALTVPGGCLLATLPFRHRAAHTHARPEKSGGGLDIGWDILTQLRAAGFVDATVLLYWSNELGYLGGHNFIVKATA